MPEGIMLNYLARRTNPTPYILMTPVEVAAFGETNILGAYQRSRPDYVVIVHREGEDWETDYFGHQRGGYGYDLMQWVRTHYTVVWGVGPEPLQGHAFGIRVLKRNDL